MSSDMFRIIMCTKSRLHSKVGSSTSPPTIETGVSNSINEPLQYYFETGIALFAKKTPRPFPPPFLSPPSWSFSDPLSTHNKCRNKHTFHNGELIRGYTNGDDAVYVSNHFIAANDGVGAWSNRVKAHPGLKSLILIFSTFMLILSSLWSRLILHFWALETENNYKQRNLNGRKYEPDPIQYLHDAYMKTLTATSEPNKCQGSTTAAGAQLYYNEANRDLGTQAKPLLYVTNLGDSQVFVVRPRDSKIIFKTMQQWHWFDFPLQLGSSSPDTPRKNATLNVVEIEEGDIVLAVSDGVPDNLWEHEITENVLKSIQTWKINHSREVAGKMNFVANELMKAARYIATDPFAGCPYMEKALGEGIAIEGGNT